MDPPGDPTSSPAETNKKITTGPGSPLFSLTPTATPRIKILNSNTSAAERLRNYILKRAFVRKPERAGLPAHPLLFVGVVAAPKASLERQPFQAFNRLRKPS
jgi:hypothetical protein